MNKNILRITLIILLLGTFHIIFGFSSQDGEKSGSISKKITETIISKIPQIQEKEEDEKQIILIRAEKIIRKRLLFDRKFVAYFQRLFELTIKKEDKYHDTGEFDQKMWWV